MCVIAADDRGAFFPPLCKRAERVLYARTHGEIIGRIKSLEKKKWKKRTFVNDGVIAFKEIVAIAPSLFCIYIYIQVYTFARLLFAALGKVPPAQSKNNNPPSNRMSGVIIVIHKNMYYI